MAENSRSPSADVIDVIVAIHIKDMRALGFVDEKGLAADGAKGAHRRVHSPGNPLQGFGK